MSVVRKKELVDAIAKSTGLHKQAAAKFMEGFIDESRSFLSAGDSIYISGLVNFKSVEKKEKIGRNPSTGASIVIPAHKGIKTAISKDIVAEVKKL
jgi:DNA-binding protein HU-beta